MTSLQAIILAAVILPALLGWNVDENADGFLPFLVVMHLGTAIALLLYFWRDWYDFGMAVVVRRGPAAAAERKLFFQVLVATLPAVEERPDSRAAAGLTCPDSP